MQYQIEVRLKDSFRDKHGEHIKHEVAELGVKGIAAVKYSPVYKLEGNLSLQEAERIAGRLLVDPITEQYSVMALEGKTKPAAGKDVVAEIWLKRGVTDTVAESVAKAVKDIGVKETLRINTGHKFTFTGRTTPSEIKQVAQKLLFNPMIQECNILK